MSAVEVIEQSFRDALRRLHEALDEPKSPLARDASVKRFELCFELAWKTVQRRMREEGIVCQSPKSCLQEAFRTDLIKDDPLWAGIIEDRNLSVHTYDEQFAEQLYSRLHSYLPLFDELSKAFD